MQIEHEAERRFFIRVEGGEAELSYRALPNGVLDLTHTFVPPEARRQGLGGALVEHAFAHAREHGMTIRPSCSFARAWAADHPDQADLLAAPD